jgi:hypothetical protein
VSRSAASADAGQCTHRALGGSAQTDHSRASSQKRPSSGGTGSGRSQSRAAPPLCTHGTATTRARPNCWRAGGRPRTWTCWSSAWCAPWSARRPSTGRCVRRSWPRSSAWCRGSAPVRVRRPVSVGIPHPGPPTARQLSLPPCPVTPDIAAHGQGPMGRPAWPPPSTMVATCSITRCCPSWGGSYVVHMPAARGQILSARAAARPAGTGG